MTTLILLLSYMLLSFEPPEYFAPDKEPAQFTEKDIYKYEQKAMRKQEKEKYEFSLMPESGYMTIEEYENKSADVLTSERKIGSYEPKVDKTMEFVPQYTYKLVKYNNPPGSPDLEISTKLLYDREFVSPGIVSPDKSFLIYPVTNFYAANQCVTGDLFMIKLDKSKSELQRVMDANIIKRVQTPIMSTEKDISEKFIFRSLTPVDFSEDGNILLVKEKIGSIQDGVWQTNMWTYNFRTQKTTLLSEAQETLKYYWRTNAGLFLNDKRWDIYPIGFSADHPDLIIFNAYAFTGRAPKFLGTWSVDVEGEFTELVSLKDVAVKMSLNGYKTAKDGVIDPSVIYNTAKAKHKKQKEMEKQEKKAKKAEHKKKRDEYRAKIREMKAQEREGLKRLK